MIQCPDWLVEIYKGDVLEGIVKRVCNNHAMADRIEEELRERLIDMAAENHLPDARLAGFALLKSVLGHVLVDCLRRRHLVQPALANEAIDALGAREPVESEPERAWEICEADLVPWGREHCDALVADLAPGLLRLLALPDGVSDEAAAARLAMPLKQLRRERCRLLLRLAQARLRLEGDAPAGSQAGESAREPPVDPGTRRRGTKGGGRARRSD